MVSDDVKFWVTVALTSIQIGVTVFGVIVVAIWLHTLQRKADKKERKIDRQEARQKANSEGIAAILTRNYDEVAERFQNLKKHVDELKGKKVVMVSPGRLYTESDVLLYMCHREKWQIFSIEPIDLVQSSGRPSVSDYSCGEKAVISDVQQIMKFFIYFCIKIPFIDEKPCPNIIKSEFLPQIIAMGETIYPFVTPARQNVIERVLKYFTSPPVPPLGSSTSTAALSRCYRRRRGSEHEDIPTSHTAELQERPQLNPYVGNDKIKHKIPYIEYYRYEGGKMSFELPCKYSAIKVLETLVKEREIEINTSEVLGKIKNFLPLASDDLLHSVRMVMFRLIKHSDFDNELVVNFANYARDCVNSPSIVNKNAVIEKCKISLEKIEQYIKSLQHGSDKVRALLELKDTQMFLEGCAKNMEKFFQSKFSS